MLKKWIVLVVFLIGSDCFAQGLDQAFLASTTGLLAQRYRLGIVAQNLANLSTLKDTSTGMPYRKQYVILDQSKDGVQVTEVKESLGPFGRYFDPGLPQTDENGFYYYPNVSYTDEMLVLAYTENIYEANITALKTTKSLYNSTIDALK